MSMNIPQLSVEEVLRQLCRLYGGALTQDYPLRMVPAVFLWGAPGIGKSHAVRELHKKLQALGKKGNITEVHLLLYSLTDMRGLPTLSEDKKSAVWIRPEIFAMDDSKDVINILFLDELSAAFPSVQAAAYQLCLERRVGEHELPDNCIVIAAGNRTTDQSVAYKMPRALANRFIHFEVESNYKSWRRWAINEGINEKIIAYLDFDNSRLHSEPETDAPAYPTPRTWEFVNKVMRLAGDDPAELQTLIAGAVGNDTAIEFAAFCAGVLDMPSVDDILAGKCTECPKKHDVLYALTAALVAALKKLGDKLTDRQLENVCSYVLMRFPKDFAVSFVQDLRRMPELDKKLMKCNVFQVWLAKNRWAM